MSEVSLIDVKAQVMTYDEGIKKWTPSGSGEPSISKVQLFVHQQNKTHRIVARKIVDKEVVINCALVKGMRYNRATETFHQWRDTRQVYGLNFAIPADAMSFGDAVLEALEGGSKRNSQNVPVNGELERQQLEKERQKLLDEQREQERLARMREADDEADRRRVAEEKLRKDREEKARLDQEKKEQEELQRKLHLQRVKEEEDERVRVAEQERLLQEQVAQKQRELDSMRAMETKIQEDMENKVKSSPTPKGTGRRVELQDEIAEPVVGNTFGVQLKSPNPTKTEFSPAHTKSSVQTYDEHALDDIQPIEPERPPSPVYNYPSPPPDMPASFHTGAAGGNKHKVSTQSLTPSSSKPKPKTDSQKGGQNNLMDEIQKRFESMKQRSGAREEGNSPAPTSPYPGNRNVSPNPVLVKPNLSFNANEKKDNIKQDSFKNKQTSNIKNETTTTSKELQALKTEIMKEIKIELERTKQEILTEIRKELSKR